MKLIIKILLVLIIFINYCVLLNSSELSKIRCDKEVVSLEIFLPKNDLYASKVYFKNFYNYPLSGCQLKHYANNITFQIYLNEFYKCGFTKVVNILKGQATYYQTIILQLNPTTIYTINIKCWYNIGNFYKKSKHKLVRRDALPNDFKEEDNIEVLETLQQQAPEPEIQMEVRQNDQLIDGMVTVIPGTPLIMQVKLNGVASSVYGLKVNYLEVSDTKDMSETIIFRGCTVDPYLFENFNISESHTLKSKFRAFKFPNTSFVQFRANVQICLKKCSDPQCSNGQQGQKRRKRGVDDNYLHEISVNLLLNIDETINGNKDEFMKLQQHVKLLTIKNLALRNLN